MQNMISWKYLLLGVCFIIILEVGVGSGACRQVEKTECYPKARGDIRSYRQIFEALLKYRAWAPGRNLELRSNRKRSLRHSYERAKFLGYDVPRMTVKPHQSEPLRSVTSNVSPENTLIEDVLALRHLKGRLSNRKQTLRSKLFSRQTERAWWGIWSTWSACGRTCGSGVHFQERHCLGSKRMLLTGISGKTACGGPGKRYRICNTDPCPTSTITFRKLQCLQYASESIRGSYYNWKPYGHPADEVVSNEPCQLVCVSNDNEIQISKIAMDGTECHKGWDPGRCVEGKCQLIGCDGKFNSGKLRDRCGSCDGRRASCIITDDVFSEVLRSPGEYDVVTLPGGAYDILINERQKTSASIVVKDTQNNVLFDGGGEPTRQAIGAEGWPSNLMIAGAEFRYRRPLLQSSETNFEYLLSEGPIKGPIIVYLRAKHRTVGTLHYEFKTRDPGSALDDSELITSVSIGGGISTTAIPISLRLQIPSSERAVAIEVTRKKLADSSITHERTSLTPLTTLAAKSQSTPLVEASESSSSHNRDALNSTVESKTTDEHAAFTSGVAGVGTYGTAFNNTNYSQQLTSSPSDINSTTARKSEMGFSLVPPPNLPKNFHGSNGQGTELPKKDMTNDHNHNTSRLSPEDINAVADVREESSTDQASKKSGYTSVAILGTRVGDDTEVDLSAVSPPSHQVKISSVVFLPDSDHSTSSQEDGEEFLLIREVEVIPGNSFPQTGSNDSEQTDSDGTPFDTSPLIQYKSLGRIFRPKSGNETDLIAGVSMMERQIPHGNGTYSKNMGGDGNAPTTGGGGASLEPGVNVLLPSRYGANQGRQQSSLTASLYGWRTNGYAPCSSTCTVGLQDSYAVCQRRSDKIMVDESYCNPATRPEPVKRSCTNKRCEPRWEATPWSECSLSCGTGIQMRAVRCWRMIGPGFDSTLYTEGCGHLNDKKPKETKPCKILDSCGPLWETSDWSDCPAPCGTIGVKWRTVRCSAGLDSMCANSRMPITEEECRGPPCLLTWMVTDWGVCSGVCRGGRKSRRVICSDLVGNTHPEDQCDPATKPPTSHPCGDTNCRPEWIVQGWELCSVTCGGGTRIRKVMCAAIMNGAVHQYEEDTPCIGTPKPVRLETCTMRTCDPVWFTTSWSKCSVTCGNGHRVREVNCYLDNVPTTGCNSKRRPVDREVCRMPTCPQPRHDECRDKRTVNCTLVLRVRLCTHWYYRKVCCGSCQSRESG